jgi:hypothetical protein
MWEVLLITGVILVILTFFYKQAVCEFRLNQIEWTQKDELSTLLHEKIPLVVRGLPSASFWSVNDVMTRDCYANIPIFQEMSLVEWVSQASHDSVCPWKYSQAETIAAVSGMAVWATKWLHPTIIPRWLKGWWHPRYHCWAGNRGLQKTIATWTYFFPVDGEVMVSIMPESVESALPAEWMDGFPAQFTAKDTPFLSDVKYMDIILRPGNGLFMPAHWFVSWTSNATSNATGNATSNTVPMMGTISYHSPISLLAFHASPYT